MKVNKEKCIGCGACITQCTQEAIQIGDDGKAEINQEKCQSCKSCAGICPVGAIEE
jgi:ferredoxin